MACGTGHELMRAGLHCQKNNVHCEGYPPKEFWKSGKQRTLGMVERPTAIRLGY